MQILKIIALLIEYPDETLWENRDEALSLIAQDAPMLLPFAQQYLNAPLLDQQASWCEVFERGRATSLLLFEHVHGESRDRGQAMVDLMEQYREAGLEIDSRELPDYLPLYLEYLTTRDEQLARDGLRDIAPILALLSARLQERDSHYAELFDLLLALSGSDIVTESVREGIKQEARDDTPAALDAVWEEEQIKFLGEQSCASGEEAARQKHFAGAVAPQYLNLDDTPAGEPRK